MEKRKRSIMASSQIAGRTDHNLALTYWTMKNIDLRNDLKHFVSSWYCDASEREMACASTGHSSGSPEHEPTRKSQASRKSWLLGTKKRAEKKKKSAVVSRRDWYSWVFKRFLGIGCNCNRHFYWKGPNWFWHRFAP